MLNVRIAHLDNAQSCIIIKCLKRRKRGKYRLIPIPLYFQEELFEYIESYKDQTPQSKLWEYSRRTATNYISDIMKKSRINGIHACARALRHHFGVRATMTGVAMPLIQKWMGHASIQTTQIYTQIMGDEEKQIAQRVW